MNGKFSGNLYVFSVCVTLENVQISKMMYVTINVSFLSHSIAFKFAFRVKSLFCRQAFFELMRISAYVSKTKSGGKGLRFKR